MGSNDSCACLSVVSVLIIATFAIIGGCLMGLSTPQNFQAPMFIVGFVFVMLDSLFVLGLITYGIYMALCY